MDALKATMAVAAGVIIAGAFFFAVNAHCIDFLGTKACAVFIK